MEARIAKLEKELAELKAELKKAKPAETPKVEPVKAEPSKDGTPLKLFYKDGLRFKSEDGDFDLSVGGYIIETGRFFATSNPGSDTFYNKTTLGVKGRLYGHFRYEAEGLLSGTSSSLYNSFVEYQQSPAFALRVGQFKEPFLRDETVTVPFRDFAEASIADRLAPQRDIGVMASGKVWADRLDYELGYFNGAGRNANDTNDDKDWAGRLTLSPFVGRKDHVLQKLQVFGQGTWGRQNSTAPNGGVTSAFTMPDTGTQFLTFSPGVLNSEDRTRYGGGAVWARGPASLKGEFVTMRMDLEKTANNVITNPNTRFDAWYATVGWVLTGEDATPGARLVPKNLVTKAGGWGAWEALFRLSGFQTEREPFFNLDKQFGSSPQPTATGTGSTTNVNSWMAGLNWMPISNAKVFLDYGENDYGQDYVGALGADVRGKERFFMLSTQFDF